MTPSADLAANTQYTATLTGGASAIKGATGTPLATVSWTFTTAAPTDTTPPTVTAKSPAANATGVAVASHRDRDVLRGRQRCTGSAARRSRSSRNGHRTAANVAATVTYDATSRVATLTPSANLAVNTPYTATLTGGASAIRDAANNPLATVSWTFTTAAAPADTTAPTVTSAEPRQQRHLGQPHGEHHGHLQRARQRCQRHHVQLLRTRHRHQRHTASVQRR